MNGPARQQQQRCHQPACPCTSRGAAHAPSASSSVSTGSVASTLPARQRCVRARSDCLALLPLCPSTDIATSRVYITSSNYVFYGCDNVSHSYSTTFELGTFSAQSKFIECFKCLFVKRDFIGKTLFNE